MSKYLLSLLLLLSGVANGQTNIDIEPYRRQRSYTDDSLIMEQLKKDPDNVEALIYVCNQLMTELKYDEVVFYAQCLRRIGKSDDNDRASLYGSLYLGKVCLMNISERDSVLYHYNIALELAKKLGDSYALSSTYNGLGIYSVNVEMDYYRGLSLFRDALKAAGDKTLNPEAYGIALNNTAMTYYLRNDAAGVKFAEEAYQVGHELKKDFQIFSGAFVCAYMYYMVEDYDRALAYIEEALTYNDQFNIRTEMYSLYANILQAMGNYSRAEEYYRKALEHIEGSAANAIAMTYLSYGSYLMTKGDNHGAIPLLSKGIEVSHERNNAAHRYKLYQQISKAYEDLGDFRNSLAYHKIYHKEADSIFNIERERSVSELMIEYEAEKRENELQQNRIKLMQKQKELHTMLFVSAIILVGFAAIYILYRRKNKLYGQIVKKYHEFLEKERRLDERIGSALYPDGHKHSGETDDKEEELFTQLEELMKTRYVYRDCELTIEKLADRLGTNRTYLSRAISQKTNGYFNTYINTYRIDEAIRILSDSDNDQPLKAIASDLGFSSIQTFYAAFKGQVGMPPSKFREKYMHLYRNKTT